MTLPDIRIHTLANGCRVALRPTPGKDILAIVAGTRWGGRDDRPDEAGLTHLMARLLIKGTKHRTALEIAETMEAVGGSIEPFCGHDLLGIETQTVVEDWPVALDVLSDCLFAPNFPAAEFEKERALVQAEIRRSEDEKFSLTYHKFLELFYARHPYGIAAEGDVETVGALEREAVAALHGRVLRSDSLVLVAVGNVPEDEFLREVERRFPAAAATVPAPERRRVVYAPGLGAGLHLTVNKAVEQGFIVAGYSAPRSGSPENTALRLACGVLGEGMSARLFARLRDRDHLAYAIGASLVNRELASHVILYIGTSPATIDAAREGLLREARGLLDDLPTAEEFERARRYILGKHLLGRQTNSVLAQGMVSAELAGLGWDWSDRFPDRMAAVTSEAALDVVRARFLLPAVTVLRPSGEAPAGGADDNDEPGDEHD